MIKIKRKIFQEVKKKNKIILLVYQMYKLLMTYLIIKLIFLPNNKKKIKNNN